MREWDTARDELCVEGVDVVDGIRFIRRAPRMADKTSWTRPLSLHH
jgi:hypothetical protein